MSGDRPRRIVCSAALGLGIAACGIFGVLASSAANTPRPNLGMPPAVAKSTDVSTLPRIKTYLRSMGVDPAGVVIQRGAKNYAGPNCPGAGWNCTTSTKVVQLSLAGKSAASQNRFVCNPRSARVPPTNEATNTCVIVQGPPLPAVGTANNSARCDIETHQADGTIDQTCFITQNGTRNTAFARLVAVMAATGTSQDVFQTISVKQTAGAGGNTLDAIQSANASSGPDASSSSVTQNVHQLVCGNQGTSGSGTGPNLARVNQSQSVTAAKTGADVVDISQNTRSLLSDRAECKGPAIPFPTTFHPASTDCAVDDFSPAKESANACARIHQISGSGSNTILLGQLDSLRADVDDTTGAATIVQGNPSTADPFQTGTDATLDQESTGLSQIFDGGGGSSFQGGITSQIADMNNTGGLLLVDQTDVGPRCCAGGHQVSHVGNDFIIRGTLTQRVFVDGSLPDPSEFTNGAISQDGKVYADCVTSGNPSMGGGCIVDLAASNNTHSETVHEGPAMAVHEQAGGRSIP